MKEYQIPRLKDATIIGAVWLFALGALLMLSPSASEFLATRVLTGGFALAGAIFLLKIGLDIDEDENVQPVLVKARVSRPSNGRRAA